MSGEGELYHIRKDEWDRMRQSVEDTQKGIHDLTIMVSQFLEREKASDANVMRAQQTADEAMRIAYEAKNSAERAESASGRNGNSVDRWQDMVFKIIAGLVVVGVSGAIGYMVAA